MSSPRLIRLPSRLDPGVALSFIAQLYSLPENEHYIFDFQHLQWVEPFALLYVSYHLTSFKSSKAGAKFDARNFNNNKACQYAAHLGFFKSFGLQFGNNPGEAPGNSHYAPITIYDVNAIKQQSYEEGIEVGDVLEKRARGLAQMLTRDEEGDLVDTLEFSLREMFRNVVEHSGALRIGFCAQYWPRQQKVELSILDSGIGIRGSIKSNPHLQIDSDKDALNYALLPGISGKTYKGSRKQRRGVWSNSGFGLFMTSELCRNGGSFLICSGSAGVFLRNENKKNIQANLSGTALRLVLNTENIGSVKESLNGYRDKGRSIAAKLSGAVITPSMASTMLARDFK